MLLTLKDLTLGLLNVGIDIRIETPVSRHLEDVLDDPLIDELGHKKVSRLGTRHDVVCRIWSSSLDQTVFDGAWQCAVSSCTWNISMAERVHFGHLEYLFEFRHGRGHIISVCDADECHGL